MTDQLFIRVPLQPYTALLRQLTSALAENLSLRGAPATHDSGFEVVADRDRGDDPAARDVREGDRVTVGINYSDGAGVWGTDSVLVRIERPAPTTDEPRRVPEASCFRDEPHGPHYWGQHQGDKYTKHCLGVGSEHTKPPSPTREQVYQAAQDAAIYPLNHRERTILDAVLALIEDGGKPANGGADGG